MILQNLIRALRSRATTQQGKNLSGTNNEMAYGVYPIHMLKTSNDDNVYFNYGSATSSGSDTKTFWLDVGFGDTPVTAEDYALADSNYADRKLDCTVNFQNAYDATKLLSYTAIFKNNGSESVTVKEIGLVGNLSSQFSANNLHLFLRKVLSTPITIAPGEAYSFTYEINVQTS